MSSYSRRTMLLGIIMSATAMAAGTVRLSAADGDLLDGAYVSYNKDGTIKSMIGINAGKADPKDGEKNIGAAALLLLLSNAGGK